tara:strand:+ start:234 stop:461 length:228 start_codon:yes stop_codon:yes gene_type:complete
LKKKIILSFSIAWLLFVGYLTWYNGIKAAGRYKGFNWEEWFWFGFIPLFSVYFFYFIWQPEAFKNFIKEFKELFK